MATKKTGKKTPKEQPAKKASGPKITLPAFGLAEDILGPRTDNKEDQHGANNQGPSAAGDNFENLSRKADDPATRDNGPMLHLVTFSLDGEEYGVDISSVHEIIRVIQITAVPNAPDFVKGVINLRGRVIPVLNLRKRLEMTEGVLTKNSRIMVVECGTKILGLLVDGVSHVIRIPAASVDTPPGEVEGTRAFVKGIGKIDSRLIMIMELDKVLAREARQAIG